MDTYIRIQSCDTIRNVKYKYTVRCMHDLESEWPTHNQGKTLQDGWLREKNPVQKK